MARRQPYRAQPCRDAHGCRHVLAGLCKTFFNLYVIILESSLNRFSWDICTLLTCSVEVNFVNRLWYVWLQNLGTYIVCENILNVFVGQGSTTYSF